MTSLISKPKTQTHNQQSTVVLTSTILLTDDCNTASNENPNSSGPTLHIQPHLKAVALDGNPSITAQVDARIRDATTWDGVTPPVDGYFGRRTQMDQSGMQTRITQNSSTIQADASDRSTVQPIPSQDVVLKNYNRFFAMPTVGKVDYYGNMPRPKTIYQGY
ncbi:Hypothetical predicted protein [Olea europaea subsp. europaea]|uniref:Uncharacterized protein n=1 Tax=Olea europaea subsp. europaea TaxID=158383 RepID=A0A8S0TSC2_OLEEU|nr:Hypothetical predicted protein [Olea europaea subsp. europaea]